MKKFIYTFIIGLFLFSNFYIPVFSNDRQMRFDHTILEGEGSNVQYAVNAEIDDIQAAEHIYKAEKSENINEKLRQYNLAVKILKEKQNPSVKDITAVSAVHLTAALLYYNAGYKEKALNINMSAYVNLRKNNLDKNSPAALLSLIKILEISKELNKQEFYGFAAQRIERTQIELGNSYPFIYEYLFSYYNDINNKEKAEYYLTKCKRQNFTIIYDKLLYSRLEIPVKDEQAAFLIYKALSADKNAEKSKYAAEAVKYYKEKKKTDKNDIKAMAAMMIFIGDSAKGIINFEISENSYLSAYQTLKKYNLHKNSQLAAYCLMNNTLYAKTFENKELFEFAANELEKYQLKLADKVPEIYSILENYYEAAGNKTKAEYYKNKLNKCAVKIK